MKYKVWDCKLVLHPDTPIPTIGFDSVPRRAVIEAVEKATGHDILSCFSGWAGKLTEVEEEIVEEDLAGFNKVENLYKVDFKDTGAVVVDHSKNVEIGYPTVHVIDENGLSLPIILFHPSKTIFEVRFGFVGEPLLKASGTVLYRY